MTNAVLHALFEGPARPEPDAIARVFGEDAEVRVEGATTDVRLGQRHARAVLSELPLATEELDQSLVVAHLRADQKSRLRAHTSHAVLTCDGEADAGDLFMLYALAAALTDGALVGVVNPITGMALDGDMLRETLEEDFVEAFLEHPATSLGLWLGFVKLFRPDGGIWLVTRGGELMALPNLACLVGNRDEIDRVYDMFVSILDYVSDSGAALLVGQRLELAGEELRLVAPYEYENAVGVETLVVERVGDDAVS